MSKLVSIIIPSYNGEVFLRETLSSIYNQTYKNIEIILIDDGSYDNTRQLIENNYPNVVYVYQENSGGGAKPRNVGMDIAIGDYYAIFDYDDVMLPEKIETQVEFLDTSPDVQFIFTDFIKFKGNIKYPCSHIDECHKFKKLLNICEKRSKGYICNGMDIYNLLFMENVVSPSAVMFRRELIQTTGNYDESLMCSEDIDFHFRVFRNCLVGYIPKVLHYRRLHSSNMSNKTELTLLKMIETRERQLPINKSIKSQIALRKSLAKFCISLAYYYRCQSDWKKAQNMVVKAFLYWPLTILNLLELFKLLLRINTKMFNDIKW